jgi:hypothetical protein
MDLSGDENSFPSGVQGFWGEETIQTWVDVTNYKADRYVQSGRNMEEEEKERENDYELCAFLNHYIVIL